MGLQCAPVLVSSCVGARSVAAQEGGTTDATRPSLLAFSDKMLMLMLMMLMFRRSRELGASVTALVDEHGGEGKCRQNPRALQKKF